MNNNNNNIDRGAPAGDGRQTHAEQRDARDAQHDERNLRRVCARREVTVPDA